MLVSYNGLVKLVEDGVLTNVSLDMINAASIDITLGGVFYVERKPAGIERNYVILSDDPLMCKPPNMDRIELSTGETLTLGPGEVVLAQSQQVFNLPNNISAEYKEKSSMGRVFLNHMMAGWCDAGWNGSVLTLELKNELKHHSIIIPVGVRIGQMVFHQHEPVPREASYAQKGRYNGDTETKGMKP